MDRDPNGANLPRRIGGYDIVGRLASGGMAEILLGRRSGPAGFERPVVIKRILPHLAREKSFVEMFLDEARISAGIRHPNVVHVEDLGHEGEDYFLVMEYLEGETAGTVSRRLAALGRSVPPALAAHVAGEVAAGLHAAHELRSADGFAQNLVHRDVSTANVFVTYDGHVKILDFGVAKAVERITMTEAGQLKGTYSFMSPEQARGEPLDRRSDLFSLGAVLYELSTQRRLFQRPTRTATLRAVIEAEIARPSRSISDYPERLEAVVMRALDRSLDRRFQTALDLRRELLSIATDLSRERPPQEALASLMQTYFVDRIEEKREMMRRFREGGTISNVPAPEPERDMAQLLSAEPTTPGKPAPTPRASGSNRRASPATSVVAILLAFGIFGAIAVVYAMSSGAGATEGSPAPAPPHVEHEPFVDVEGTESGAPAPAEAVVRTDTVVVRIRSSPEGASAVVGDVTRGMTPLDLELPRSSDAVLVRLTRAGYRSETQSIVPDSDQALHLALQRATEKRAAVRAEDEPVDEPAAPVAPEPVEPSPESAETAAPAAAPPPSSMNRFERFN